MSYEIKYFMSFKNIDNKDISVRILEKGYRGTSHELMASGSNPVILDYKSGDFYANDPIRASTATIKYYNTGNYPMTVFASNDDTKYLVHILVSDSIIWQGFISHEDCVEDLTPIPNEVAITCSDGLGMLREAYFTDLSGNLVFGQLSLKSVFYYILYGKTGLSLPVRVYCNLFENGMSDRSDDLAYEPFAQTVIDCRSFLLTEQTVQDFASGPNAQIVKLKDKVQDCYTIMQNILDAWGCTIIQANGYWNIVRWHELKQFNNSIPGTQYDSTLSNPVAITFDNIKTIQNPSASAYFHGINLTQWRQLFRGNEFTRLTFNYVQPYKLLLNSDLSLLGNMIRTFTNGTGVNLITTKDYVFNDWVLDPDNTVVPYPLETFIRVEYNYLGIEIDRFAVLTKGIKAQGIWSTPFNVNVGDRANFSFRVATNNNTTRPDISNSTVIIKLFPSGTTDFSLANTNYHGLIGDCTTGGISSADGIPKWAYSQQGCTFINHNDLINGFDVSIDIPPFPIDGLMLIELYQLTHDDSGTSATYYKGINFKLYWYIDGNLQVTGQYNESRQAQTIKKNIDKLVHFDDSPKDDIQGVMYLTDGATKTSSWRRWPLTEDRKFGWVQSVDWMYLTNAMRSKIDGQYRGLTDNTALLMSPLTVVKFESVSNGNFIFGQCSFDLKNAEFSGTVQEVYNTGEYAAGYAFGGSEFTNTFNHLFSGK